MAGCGLVRGWGKKCVRVSLAVAVATVAFTGYALEPLRYYGFDEAAYSPLARDGMHEIFAGHLFEVGDPIAGGRLVVAAQA